MRQYRTDSRVESLALLGGAAAIAVSIGLSISLEMRDEGFNLMNAFTLIASVGAGFLAIRGARRPDGANLGSGTVLLVIAMLPTVFGWVVLLYLPSLILLIAAMVRFITMPEPEEPEAVPNSIG